MGYGIWGMGNKLVVTFFTDKIQMVKIAIIPTPNLFPPTYPIPHPSNLNTYFLAS